MGKRGPKPLPTKILELRGSWRAKRRPEEPAPPAGVPPIPPWVCPAAAKHWERVVAILEPYGILTLTDGEALGLLVEAVADFLETRDRTEKAKGRVRMSWQRVKNAAWDRVLKAFREFGLTPSARSGVVKSGGSPEEKDPLAAFAAKKQSG